nr:alpha-ketoglutarate-dependent dioxygenase AlkB [Oceanobacter mangrovi]
MPGRPLDSCRLLHWFPGLLTATEAEQCFQQLLHQHDWPASDYEVFGRCFRLPRQQTWHADPGIVYSYHNNLLVTRPWSPLLLGLRHQVEAATGLVFNSVLVNLYRTGQEYVGWHSDDDPEMGADPVIASLSLGAARPFSFRPLVAGTTGSVDTDAEVPADSLLLEAGDLLLMAPDFQHHWQHAVLPCEHSSERINLTFRYVYPPQV